MKRLIALPLLLLIIQCVSVKIVKAQDITANPGAYMTAITDAETLMNKSYMSYISAYAHSNRKGKIERLRQQAVNNIVICQNTINYLPAYKNDNSLRQNSLSYVQLCYKIFNDDYAHIVNMDEITERSYDEMQAFLLLQQATNDTLEIAVARINKAQTQFATKYNVTVTNSRTELSDKMEATGKLNKYRNKVYLLFYKCNWEENQLTTAVNEKNVTKIEQMRSALNKYANEGIAVLDTIHAFENDRSLVQACKQALVFYKNEAETKTPVITDFFLKEESFSKLKITMDAKPKDQRTKQDVDTFNAAVNDINVRVNTYNQINNELNATRNEVNTNWMNTQNVFIDTHTPYYN